MRRPVWLFLLLCLGGCNGDAPQCMAPQWRTLLDDGDSDADDLEASLMSVWGSSRSDLWFAGGTLGVAPRRGVGVHFDGQTWTEVPLEVPQSLWWVTTTPQGSVWFAGEEGLVVRIAGGNVTTFEDLADATLFGIWGSSDSDVWAVGGDLRDGDRDVLLHFDGTEWSRVPPPEAYGVQLFKVWGCAPNDVWVVGAAGVILHYDGKGWTGQVYEGEKIGRPQLFTVHGRACDDVWAVGSSSAILHWDGTAWSPYVDPSGDEVFAGLLNGVYAPVGGDVCAVGLGGAKIWIPDEGSHVNQTLVGTGSDLHGVWCDAEGAFAVGGNFFSPAPAVRQGTIAQYGCEVSTDGLPAYTPDA